MRYRKGSLIPWNIQEPHHFRIPEHRPQDLPPQANPWPGRGRQEAWHDRRSLRQTHCPVWQNRYIQIRIWLLPPGLLSRVSYLMRFRPS